MGDVAVLAGQLIECASVCPKDEGAQEIIANRLKDAGFEVEHLRVDGIRSLYASFGTDGPLFAFSGHSDVVPAGNLEEWTSPPFEAHVRGGNLFGRGAIDMKGPMAASVIAGVRFASRWQAKDLPFRVAFMIAGDEEVMSNHGTKDLLALIESRGDKVRHCVVTESTSHEVLGDMVKIGRRGSIVGQIIVKGIQGHSAYPHLASNPISKALPLLASLDNEDWGAGTEGFPATSFQWTNLQAGTGAANVIPGELFGMFNMRFSPDLTVQMIKERVEERLQSFGLDYQIKWSCDAFPFKTEEGVLSQIVSESVYSKTGLRPELSTTGGTSDARFIAPSGAEVIELGTLSRMCHQIDEHVAIADLDQLALIYEDILDRFAAHYGSSNQ